MVELVNAGYATACGVRLVPKPRLMCRRQRMLAMYTSLLVD